MPPTRTVISGAVSVSNCALSTSISSAGTARACLEVVAEPVGGRLEHGEGIDVGLLLRRVRAPRREGNRRRRGRPSSPPARRRRNRRGRSGRPARPSCRRLRGVERLLDRLERLQHLRQLGRLVDLPILLRREADARAVRPAALVGAAEGRRRGPGGRDQLRDGQPRREDLGLERGDVLRVDQRVVDRRDGVLPDQFLRRAPPGRDSARAGPCRGASA